MLKKIARWYLNYYKWQFVGSYPFYLKKSIIIVAPHTSNIDFIIGLMVRSVLKLYHVKFLGKHILFQGPWGVFFKRLGGISVDRSSSHQMVEKIVDIYNKNDSFTLVLSPEGTRKQVKKFKSGFYYIALKAKIPIIMAGIDYKTKSIHFSSLFYITEDKKADFGKMYDFFRPFQGKNYQENDWVIDEN